MNSLKFARIKVTGEISVGDTYRLVQVAKKEQQEQYRTSIAGAPRMVDSLVLSKAESIGQIYEHSLSEKSVGQLAICGDGLVTSFGIFGAPGSGKTVLLMHLLNQVLQHEKDNSEKKYGALILDPKASLIEEITKMAKQAGREQDLVVINSSLLNSLGQKINVIDCSIEPYELGSILVMAARSAGSGASDPFWFQEWSNLFASALNILRFYDELYFDVFQSMARKRIVNLKRLLEVLFDRIDSDSENQLATVKIQHICKIIKGKIENCAIPAEQIADLKVDILNIERFYKQKHTGTIEAFITKSFGMFRRDKYKCFSSDTRAHRHTFYDDIIENGKIVLISISPSEPVMAKTLCTLVKCLFQRAVLSRGELLLNGTISNDQRPLVMACDEYSEIASEIPGESMGDGQFLALARQYGCMALLATQSVNVLQASSLKETWRSVFSNFAAKFYMRLVDNETAEEAVKLAGESDWKISSHGKSSTDKGFSANQQESVQTRKNLQSSTLTHMLKRGEAVVIGSLDGGASTPGTYFIKVPHTIN